jgi:hypothetical protein
VIKPYYFITFRQAGGPGRPMIEAPASCFIDEEPWEFIIGWQEKRVDTVILLAIPVTEDVYKKFKEEIY